MEASDPEMKNEPRNEYEKADWCCQNCILRVQGNIWSELFLLKKFAVRSQNWQVNGKRSLPTWRMISLSQFVTTEKERVELPQFSARSLENFLTWSTAWVTFKA